MSWRVMSCGLRARTYPPAAPRALSTSPARFRSRRICTRNRSEMPCLFAMSARRIGRGSAYRAASSSIATHAYSALAENNIVVSVQWTVDGGQMARNGGAWLSTVHCPLSTGHYSNALAVLVLDHVQAALLLDLPCPAAGAVVFARGHRSRARPAPDARVVAVVQRVVGHVVFGDEPPNFLLGPVQERVHL